MIKKKRHKLQYDHKYCCVKLGHWDFVLLKNNALKGKHKIQDRWENKIYKAVEQSFDSISVLKVWPRNADGKTKIVLHNLLLPTSEDLRDT